MFCLYRRKITIKWLKRGGMRTVYIVAKKPRGEKIFGMISVMTEINSKKQLFFINKVYNVNTINQTS